MNQAKYEEMLKDVLKLKTINDDSFNDSYIDVQCFPLNYLESLKEMDLKLQSEPLFLKVC